jgi:CO/xanthine dehydrogenase Mo-binding subunit
LRLASFEAGFDARGRLIAWDHRVVAESVAGYRTGLTGSAPPSIDTIVMKGSSLPQYPIPNKLVEHIVETRGARLSSVRGVGVYDNAFAVESFLDEMAKALGRDPIDFRLDLSEGLEASFERIGGLGECTGTGGEVAAAARPVPRQIASTSTRLIGAAIWSRLGKTWPEVLRLQRVLADRMARSSFVSRKEDRQ